MELRALRARARLATIPSVRARARLVQRTSAPVWAEHPRWPRGRRARCVKQRALLTALPASPTSISMRAQVPESRLVSRARPPINQAPQRVLLATRRHALQARARLATIPFLQAATLCVLPTFAAVPMAWRLWLIVQAPTALCVRRRAPWTARRATPTSISMRARVLASRRASRARILFNLPPQRVLLATRRNAPQARAWPATIPFLQAATLCVLPTFAAVPMAWRL